MSEETGPAEPAPPTYSYRVFLVGCPITIDCFSSADFITFTRDVRANGFVLGNKNYIPHEAIAMIENMGAQDTTKNIVHMVKR